MTPMIASISHLDLSADIGDDKGLVFGLLAAVAVARIDHHHRAKAGAFDLAADGVDIFGIVIRGAPAAQDDVAILIARGGGDRRSALLGDGHEMMEL
jgi:hypothetical protein